MLRSAKEIQGYAVGATDGALGHVKDFYVDDERWVIRYLVVDTGGWLSSRKVLVSPRAIGTPDWERRLLPASISREQVMNSPAIDTDKPVSRQHEMTFSGYYDYPYYWIGAEGGHETAHSEPARNQHEDEHLRSCNAVVGYHIHASDGDIGHVADMLIDEQTWAVRYLVVDTSNWWLGHQVLIAPQWIDSVNWYDKTVAVSVTRQAVKDAPTYDPQAALNREADERLYRHYGQDNVWSDHPIREEGIARV